ncbi:uncharacterized protein L3040_003775 [Drepanopeziza brunnea f. sp. 'multigermtubi']|uniref:uncharacterized protein n=1 Tax=Drepanopeziza brunnea f. sp. 'multigermtubi' TaxID=698441 RepID=UPI0023929D99|nr:hypothetical protein L3040_003775 [Drepanopeziza brunnea f. sp. 'multigermtubi']
MVLRPSFPAVPSASDEPPLLPSPQQFYINIQKHPQLNTARPDLILHSGPTKASAIMSFAKFYSMTQLTDITLCPPASSRSPSPITNFSLPRSPSAKKLEERNRPKFKFEQLVSTGGLFKAEKFEFSYTLPLSDTRETFEWQHASGFFGRTIGRDSGGLKLVRASTGDVMAVYVGLGESRKKRNPSRVVGMFRFLPGKGTVDLDEEWEILAVTSILSLVERGTRTTKARLSS